MASSLNKLASYLDECRIVSSEFRSYEESKVNLLTRQGVLPYEYFDCWDKLEERQLPARNQFKSVLVGTIDITDEDYTHAQRVWGTFNVKTFVDYSNPYLNNDVFENFRENSISAYSLDPAHYYTTPSFTWDAMLKYTDVKLQLLRDVDMILFIERGVRGGLSQCSNRYAKANNRYMKNECYDETKDSKYLMYYDANNLYGWAMMQPLPYGNFKWIDNCENFNFHTVEDDSPTGYILEVDLNYPASIHNLHNDLPFCAEHRRATKSGSGSGGEKKLIASFHPKRNYVLHYRALKQAVANGLQLKKIHRVLSFSQSNWMRAYIELNSSLKTKAGNEFERNLFKLINNAVYGITMKTSENELI